MNYECLRFDTGYWILDTGYWILDTGYWMLDTGYWILDIGYWICYYCPYGPYCPNENAPIAYSLKPIAYSLTAYTIKFSVIDLYLYTLWITSAKRSAMVSTLILSECPRSGMVSVTTTSTISDFSILS